MEHKYIQTQMCVATNIPIIAKSPTIAQSLLSKSWHNVMCDMYEAIEACPYPVQQLLIWYCRKDLKQRRRLAEEQTKEGRLESFLPWIPSPLPFHPHTHTHQHIIKEWVRMVKEDYKENIWSVREKGKGEERNMVGLSKKGRRRKTMEE